MKKRTRVLAALLTVIMVVGLLPLSLFAAEDNETTEISAAERNYETVKDALVGKGFTTYAYLDFEDQTAGVLAQSALDISGTKDSNTPKLNSDGETYSGGLITVSSLASQYVGRVTYKNYRQSFEIKEENENKSFYFGVAENTIYTSHNDNYVDVMLGAEAARGHDIFLSIDFKLGAQQIGDSVQKESLFCFINRDEDLDTGKSKRTDVPTLWVTNVGGLYLDSTLSPESLVGYFSDKEYTSVSVHIKLSENKYYVYINDILVNPEGKTFLTLNEDNTYANTGKTYDQYLLSEVRVYDTKGNTSADYHSGLHLDNIILAARPQMSALTTEAQDVFTSNFASATVGQGISANQSLVGSINGSGVTMKTVGSLPDGYFSYVKDGDDTVIKFGKSEGASSDGQAYFILDGLNGYVGKSYSLSMEIKLGSETLGYNNYQLFNPISRLTSPVTKIGSVYLDDNGKIKFDGQHVGTVTTEKYTKVTLDIVCEKTAVMLYCYIDGVLKHKAEASASPWGESSAFYIKDVALICAYSGAQANAKEEELYIKSISARLTDGYNDGANISSPFRRIVNGFVVNAGITRSYNSDGTYKKEDFTLNGIKYLVGYNGVVLGKETDGIEMSYADYFKSTFAYGTDKNVKLAESLDAAGIDTTTTKGSRSATNITATVGGETVRYYASFYNTATSASQDSYRDFGTTGYENNATVVFDFDIMLDHYQTGSNYGASGLVTTMGFDESGNITTQLNDTKLLEITSDGWLKSNGRKLVPLSKTEYTKISAVVKAPDSGKNNGTFDIYVNGVLMIDDAALKSGMYGLKGFRNFQAIKQSVGMYLKNISMYAKAEKPMQFYTLDGENLVLTSDQTKNPVKASDIKKGKVFENGIYRYYDELGLPVINGTITDGGQEYGTNENGKIGCSELNHLGAITEKGICSVCGKKADALTSIYGNSLLLGSDVKVMFYLDIELGRALGASVEIGRVSDYAAGKTIKKSIVELDTVKIAGKTYYKIGYGVPAKDIADDIKVRVIRENGTFGTEYIYSAQDYINSVKSAETGIIYSAALKSLVGALEIYSRLAEKELEGTGVAVDVASLAGIDVSSFTEAGVADTSASVGEANKADVTADNPNGLAVRTKYTLSLESNVKMIFTFKIEKGSISDYVFKIDGKQVNPVSKSGESGTYYVSNTVAAKSFNKNYTLTVENADGENLVTLTSSVLGFAKNNLAKSTDDNHKNLMRAIFRYWQVATVYSKYTNSEDNSVVNAEGIQSVLAGKTVYSFGDSLIAGHRSGLGMIDGLTKEYGMIYTKYAANGAAINLSKTGANIYGQIEAASSVCPDFVVFDGLTNDLSAQSLLYDLGTFDDSFEGPFDNTTFCGSFELTVKLLKEKYSSAQIIFVTPHNMPTRNAISFRALIDVAKELCQKWDVAIADIYYDSEIDTCDINMKQEYSYDQTEGDRVGNGTHLTSTGYDIFYAPIISRIMAESVTDSGATLKNLEGKTVYSFGDSLIQGHYSGLGMLEGLTSEYGMIYTKYAKGGNTITINGTKSNVYNQVEGASDACPDFVVFNGLTNDCDNVGHRFALGSVTEGFDGTFDTTTFCGSFEATLQLMKEKYPDAIIIFVTPHKMPTRHLESFKQLVDLSLDICKKWGVPVADIYYEGSIDTCNNEQRIEYSYNQNEGEGNGNGTHLTSTGYNIFYAPIISRVMSKSLTSATAKVLQGKTLYSFGDSLVDGVDAAKNGMLNSVVKDYGLVHTKYAIRGSTINLHNTNQEKVVYNQIVGASDVCPDFIVFNGLTNDCNKTWEIGEISEGFDTTLDTTTFCGSFETILRTLKNKFPTAKIIYVTPHKMTAIDANSLKLYVETALEICEKWSDYGISVVDIYHDSGLDLADEEMGSRYSSDGCHLNKDGYDTFYAPAIAAKLIELAAE